MITEHLKIETGDRVQIVSRSAQGGQQVGVIPKGVMITHIPTGMISFCNHHRSQMKNRDAAIRMIEWGLTE